MCEDTTEDVCGGGREREAEAEETKERDVEKVSSRHVRKCTPRKSSVFSHQPAGKCTPKLFETYLVAQPTLSEHV